MGRITVSIDDELEEQLREQADKEGVSMSGLVSRGVEYYLKENSLEARLSELEQRVEEVEADQSRSIVDSVFGRDRTPP